MIQEEDVCSKTLLTLVARGNAIITELHRLTELVPQPFKRFKRSTGGEGESAVENIICNFSYFKNSDEFEAKIESNKKLKSTDEELCNTHIDILTRFYLTFESVQRYSSDLNSFIFELEDGFYVGQSLDGLLGDNENRQLICEAYFLLGYMLLTCDTKFEGELRERLIISYYRYSSYKSSPDSNLDDTCNLMRSTGCRSGEFSATNKGSDGHQRPQGYPENYFARVGVNKTVVDLLIAKLQTIDLYNQTNATFQHPDHRSTALSQQAAILYVMLYFCPEILDKNRARMREICNRFFCDNWIISLHLGQLVNLFEAWQPYNAARESLGQLHEPESISSVVGQTNLKFSKVSEILEDYLEEGWLNEQTVLEHHSRILNQIREANVLLRWVLLHTQWQDHWSVKASKIFHSVVIKNLKANNKSMYKFLQNLSELEKKFSSIYGLLLDKKETKIRENKAKAMEMLEELIEMFDPSLNTKPIRWIESGANSKLLNQLNQFKEYLESISLDNLDANGLRDSIIKLIYQLESSRDSYSDGKNLQVVQLFKSCKESLLQIVQCLNLPTNMKVLLHSIGDFSYAWQLMDQTFTCHIQQVIKENPLKVYTIEATFNKLASAFDQCLMRIQQVNSQQDLISVSQYYSTKLVSYIRDVLQVIPATILELVAFITAIQTEYVMNELPARIPLENLKEYALPEKRFQMLELTYKVSHYAESLLMMQNTTIGLIRLNPKQLLEDGIRRELVKRMSDSIQETMQFNANQNDNNTPTARAQDLLQKLGRLVVVMTGYRRSFEYIQDYMFIYGQRMWQEELNRLIRFNVEQAIEVLLATVDGAGSSQNELDDYFRTTSIDVQKWQYQQQKAPIPVYSSDPLESSFLVRLMEELLKITDPKQTIYEEQMSAWYEQKEHNKVLDLKVFELLGSSLGAAGLNGLDQLIATLVLVELKRLNVRLQSLIGLHGKTVKEAIELLEAKKTKSFATALAKMAPHGERVANQLLRLGQLQALRSNIKLVLASLCRYEARNLYGCLATLDGALLAALKSRQLRGGARLVSSQQQQQPSSSDNNNGETNSHEPLEESQLTFELANHLDWIGLSDPMSKIYTLSLGGRHEASSLMELLFLVLLEQSARLEFSASISGFVPRRRTRARSFYVAKGAGDGQPFFYGLATLLLHLEPTISLAEDEDEDGSVLGHLFGLMGSHVRCFLPLEAAKPLQKMSPEAANQILAMIELIRLTTQRSPLGARRADKLLRMASQLPDFLLDTFQFTLCHLD